MTMRQVVGLLQVIAKDDMIQFYQNFLSYGVFHSKKLPSLEEFLGASLEQDVSPFDETTDKLLEERAQKRFEEMKAKNV